MLVRKLFVGSSVCIGKLLRFSMASNSDKCLVESANTVRKRLTRSCKTKMEETFKSSLELADTGSSRKRKEMAFAQEESPQKEKAAIDGVKIKKEKVSRSSMKKESESSDTAHIDHRGKRKATCKQDKQMTKQDGSSSQSIKIESEENELQEPVAIKNAISKQQKKKTSMKPVKDETPEEETSCSVKPRKGRGSRASKKLNGEDASSLKPELVIPEIHIPSKGEIIPREPGPSPYNGTVQFNNKVYLGAHISAAGGLENAITNAVSIGATCFALFLKSQRQWTAKPMEESTVEKFKAACAEYNFAPHLILPHGSYLMNLGSQDPVILGKSRATLLDEIQRCERLGILYYNIHPGSTCGKVSTQESIQSIADSINWVHQETPASKVSIVLENMCRQGNTIGGDLAELAEIIQLVYNRSRVGVCLDTCHALAAGYDIASEEGFEAFIEEFERVVGFRYLVAVHLNDSEGALGCHRDRHASIGKGHIGRSKDGFRRIINCPRFRDIPLVLETPYVNDDTYLKEIRHLKSLAENDTVCA